MGKKEEKKFFYVNFLLLLIKKKRIELKKTTVKERTEKIGWVE